MGRGCVVSDREVSGGRMRVYKKYLVGRPNRKGRAVLFFSGKIKVSPRTGIVLQGIGVSLFLRCLFQCSCFRADGERIEVSILCGGK